MLALVEINLRWIVSCHYCPSEVKSQGGSLWNMMLLTGCYVAWYSNRSNQEIQTYAIALINALFLKAPEDRRQVSFQHPRCATSEKKPEYT